MIRFWICFRSTPSTVFLKMPASTSQIFGKKKFDLSYLNRQLAIFFSMCCNIEINCFAPSATARKNTHTHTDMIDSFCKTLFEFTSVLDVFDPPGLGGQKGGHYFHTWCPCIRPSVRKRKKHPTTLQGDWWVTLKSLE